jgi:hypothetical protein
MVLAQLAMVLVEVLFFLVVGVKCLVNAEHVRARVSRLFNGHMLHFVNCCV